MSEQKQNNLKHMIWCWRGYECNISTHCTDILWFTFIMRLMGSRRSGCREQGLWFALAACLPLDRNMPAAVTVNTYVLQPTSANSDFWRTFLVQLHVTIKTSPACTIMDGLLFWRGWEIIFTMRRESTALVLLLAGVTSQVLFIFGVLYFNTNCEFQCHTKNVQRQGLPNVHLIYAFTEWPRNAQTRLRPKKGHLGHN